MRKSVNVVLALLIVTLMLINVSAASASMEKGKLLTATGKVISVDPQGKAISIYENSGKQKVDVGTIVDENTVVKVHGKKASLSDIKPGDTVTIKYLKSDNLYAKEIVKG